LKKIWLPARGLSRHNKRFTIEEIIEIIATRCQILRLKCTKSFVGWGSAQDPAGGAYSASPAPELDFRGPIFKGEGKEREGREGERGRGGEGRNGGGDGAGLPPS